MKFSQRTRLVTLAGFLFAFLTTLTSTASASPAPTSALKAPPGCTDLTNGSVCIYVSPANQQGNIQVTYEKWGGNGFWGHLAWRNPAGTWFGSPDVWMTSHNIYGQTWPTWVGPGCNQGILVNTTTGEFFTTPGVCV